MQLSVTNVLALASWIVIFSIAFGPEIASLIIR